jgi:hypothetical protein
MKEREKKALPAIALTALADKPSSNHRSWLVKMKMAGEVTLAPRNSHKVTAKLDATDKKRTSTLVCIEPATVPIQGIIVARVLSRVGRDTS